MTTYESFVRSYGFWRRLENCQGGQVLNPEVVALSCSDSFHTGLALVHKGETVPRPACGLLSAGATIAPRNNAVDCFEVMAGRAPFVPTRLGYRRVDLSGRELGSAELSAEQPGRVFLGPIARFYDDDGAPYFVTYDDRSKDAPACVLFTLEAGALKAVVSSSEPRVSECYDAEAWSRLAGRTLKDSLRREKPAASAAPSRPQKLRVIVR